MSTLDDLAPLLSPTPDAKVRKRFAKLVSWNSETFDNAVDLGGGAIIENLDVIAGTDALSWQPGHILVLEGYDAAGTGGWGVWWITGRVIRPGTANAASLIEFMRGSLAREIASEVFAANILHDQDTASGTRPVGAGFGDLVGAEIGPVVTSDISASGVAVAFVSCEMYAFTNGASGFQSARQPYVSVAVSGATTVAASNDNAIRNEMLMSGDASMGQYLRLTDIITFDQLNRGENTFTMKYGAAGFGSGSDPTFSRRSLMIIGL